MPEGAQGEEGAEAERLQGEGQRGLVGLVAAAEFEEPIEQGFELVGAAEGGDDAAAGAAVFPDGFAEANILIGAAAGGGLGGHEVHQVLPS